MQILGPTAKKTIKTKQKGSFVMTTATQNVTIATVIPNNSIIRVSSVSIAPDWANSSGEILIGATITNATTITLVRGTGTFETLKVEWEVIEFNGVKSKQSGVAIMISTDSIKQIAITSAEQMKSLLVTSEISLDSTATQLMDFEYIKKINTNTQIEFEKRVSGDIRVYWQLIELK